MSIVIIIIIYDGGFEFILIIVILCEFCTSIPNWLTIHINRHLERHYNIRIITIEIWRTNICILTKYKVPINGKIVPL